MRRNHLVRLLNSIDLCIQHVHVIIEGIVLLFSFDECGNNLFYVFDACSFRNLIEGIFNDFNVSHVHITQLLFLSIVLSPAVQAKF